MKTKYLTIILWNVICTFVIGFANIFPWKPVFRLATNAVNLQGCLCHPFIPLLILAINSKIVGITLTILYLDKYKILWNLYYYLIWLVIKHALFIISSFCCSFEIFAHYFTMSIEPDSCWESSDHDSSQHQPSWTSTSLC